MQTKKLILSLTLLTSISHGVQTALWRVVGSLRAASSVEGTESLVGITTRSRRKPTTWQLMRNYATDKRAQKAPEISWSLLQDHSKARVVGSTIVYASLFGLIAGGGAHTICSHPDLVGDLLWASSAAIPAGAWGGVRACRRTDEARLRYGYKKYHTLVLELQNILRNRYIALACEYKDTQKQPYLAEAIEKEMCDEHFPLVHAFEQWKCWHKTLENLQGNAERVRAHCNRLQEDVHPELVISLPIEPFENIDKVLQVLRNAMVIIKRESSWLKRVDSYNQELTRRASEQALVEAQEAKKAAKRAASDASFAATMSTISTMRSFTKH